MKLWAILWLCIVVCVQECLPQGVHVKAVLEATVAIDTGMVLFSLYDALWPCDLYRYSVLQIRAMMRPPASIPSASST
jgi:hypothetical protein